MAKPITIVQTNHGMGGPFDATRKIVATYDNWRLAMADLRDRGYSVDFDGRPISDTEPPYHTMFYHTDPEKRYVMGCITYEFENLPIPPTHNHLPDTV